MEEMKKDVKKDSKNPEQKIKKFFKNKTNLWMSISVVLAIALVLSLVWPGGITQAQAETNLLEYLNSMVGGGVTFKSTEDKGSLYRVNVEYQGQEIPIYMTKDGKYMVQGVAEIGTVGTPITGQAVAGTPAEVPKTDKPKVEAFIFSYCPYGLQFEKALLPVYNLLKNKADINIVAIGAMHGEYEKIESYRQLCVQKIYGKDKLFKYLDKFDSDSAIGGCSGNDVCLSPLLSSLMSSLGIDKNRVDACIVSDAEALYLVDTDRANSLGIGGSPTFVINGVEVSVDRTAESIKTAVCNAFNTAPSECSQTLSTSAASPGFGASSGASTGASCG